jgi:prepilin-type N-terminal cleavage/methylation domain-containing protein
MAQQRGFTLIEMMAGLAIGSVILLVAYGLLDSVVKTFGSSQHRVDVSQRGRQAMDTLTHRLRSQVCGGDEAAGFTPSLLVGEANRVVFWSNQSETLARATGSIAPDTEVDRRLRGLQLDPAGHINELIYAPTATTAGASSTPKRIVTNVAANNGGGLFRYWAYNPAAANQAANPAPPLFLELPAPLSAANLRRVVRITIGFTAYPENSNANDKLAANFNGDFLSRSASSPYEFDEPPTDAAVVEPRCR